MIQQTMSEPAWIAERKNIVRIMRKPQGMERAWPVDMWAIFLLAYNLFQPRCNEIYDKTTENICCRSPAGNPSGLSVRVDGVQHRKTAYKQK